VITPFERETRELAVESLVLARESVHLLRLISRNQEKIMADIDTLNSAVAQVAADETQIETDLAAIGTTITTVIADLKALEGQQSPDLSAAIASLTALHTKLQADDAQIVADAGSLTSAEPAAPSTPTT
jgi:peptidoglycan hydrolase CwlO-like protein